MKIFLKYHLGLSAITYLNLTYAIHAGKGPRDGFCMVMVCQVSLSVASLDASVSLLMDLAL